MSHYFRTLSLLVACLVVSCHAFLIFDPKDPDRVNRNIKATVVKQAMLDSMLVNSACRKCQDATLVFDVNEMAFLNMSLGFERSRNGAANGVDISISLLRLNKTETIPLNWTWLFVDEAGESSFIATFNLRLMPFFPIGSSVGHFSSQDKQRSDVVAQLIKNDNIIYFRKDLTTSSAWKSVMDQSAHMKATYSNGNYKQNEANPQPIFQDASADCNCHDFGIALGIYMVSQFQF